MQDLKSKESEEISVREEENQFVTFIIGGETYGVSVLKVQEIIGMTQITHVPNTLKYLKGVINLRGSVVPVIDMRIKFDMEDREYDSFTVIIFVEVKDKLVGMIIDSVSDVLSIPVTAIQEVPHFSSKIESDFIESIGQKGDELIIILDVERVISIEELNELGKVKSEVEKKK